MDSSVLFVTPYLQDGRSVAKMLEDISIPMVHAANLTEAAARLETGRFKVVLTEANLEDGTWLNVLELTRAAGIELVVTSAWADARFWATAINLGAYDMLAQPFSRMEVRRVLAGASSRRFGMKVAAAAS
jgi:DNA-binding NtrC family response regulator